ncbi:MAG: FG-GAP repeat protein [Planctomycetota bacterium]
MKSKKDRKICYCAVLVLLSVVYAANGDWSKESKLLASGPAPGDQFGRSVCINANLAIVGAPYDNDKGADSGSAYIYNYDGTNWTEQAKLTASDGAAYDYFGYSVSISGGYAIVGSGGYTIVGAHYDDDNGAESGSAYIYSYDGTNWFQQAKLTASDGAASDYFGISVSISGGHAIVGAYGDDDNGAESGSAYIFSQPCPADADLDGNCKVDFGDFAVFADWWLYGSE